jgi:hypothetical protein
MLELTEEQHRIVENEENPTLIDPHSRAAYVLVRKEVFDRIKALLVDDGEWTAEEQLRLLVESGKKAGWDDPEMAVYDNYDENRKKLCQ